MSSANSDTGCGISSKANKFVLHCYVTIHFLSFHSIIGLLIGTLIAFNVIIGDLVPSIFHNLSGVEVRIWNILIYHTSNINNVLSNCYWQYSGTCVKRSPSGMAKWPLDIGWTLKPVAQNKCQT